MTHYKAIILGSEPSGHSAAVRISQLGGKVALVERDFIGGICTNWGCTPSKSMIESAKIAQTVAESGKYGIKLNSYDVDFPAVAKRRDQVVVNTREFITDLLHHQSGYLSGRGRNYGAWKVARPQRKTG